MQDTIRRNKGAVREALRRLAAPTDTGHAPRTAGGAPWPERPTLSLRAQDILCRCASGQAVDTLLAAARALFYLGIAVLITVAQFYLLILVVLGR